MSCWSWPDSMTFRRHQGLEVSPSYAVVASSTHTTATVPGTARSPATPSRGLRQTSTRSSRRPSTDSRPYIDDITSKPSAASNQREPKTAAPHSTTRA